MAPEAGEARRTPPPEGPAQGAAPEPGRPGEQLADTVGAKAQRHLRARGKARGSVWFGLGAFGVIGWSIAVPTLAGIALGLWIDVTWPGRLSWTLALMLAGVTLGAFNAWYWISQEQLAMEREKGERDGE